MISAQIRAQVRERAHNACEYCHLHQDDSPLAVLHVEHVIPKVHGGSDDVENLALACIDCNLHKGTNLTGIDPETNEITALFHPRRQVWEDHFQRQGIYVVGKTANGRTTIRVLNINSEDQVALRSS
jgi:5-methylcytosine-specific restriction endonuclease McrA